MRRTTRTEQARTIEKWTAVLGVEGEDYVRANQGANRTEGKRRRLRTIEEKATAAGRKTPFSAKY